MSAARSAGAASRLLVLASLVGLALSITAGAAAQSLSRPAAASVDAAPRWQSLSPQQRQVLAPLEAEWSGIERERKEKWIALAGRYGSLPAPEQARIQARMAEWARLTPAERSRARLTFEEAKQVPLSDRQARWEAYQTLPPDERQRFEVRGAESAATRRAVPPPPIGRAGAGVPPTTKSNIVPDPALAGRPQPVAPTVVRAAPGATTRSIGQSAQPPAHQQAGMPKIATTPEFVNRTTLLPRRGPQAAAVAPAPAPAPAVPPRVVPPPPRQP